MYERGVGWNSLINFKIGRVAGGKCVGIYTYTHKHTHARTLKTNKKNPSETNLRIICSDG